MARKRSFRKLFAVAWDQTGTQTVEFALSLLPLMAILFGILDFSRAMYSYEFVTYAAQEGARYAMLRGADFSTACSSSAPPNFTLTYSCKASGTDVQNFVQSLALPLISRSNVSATTTFTQNTPDCSTGSCAACTTSNAKGCLVKVKVTYSFSFIAPFLPKNSSINFSGTSQKVIQQ